MVEFGEINDLAEAVKKATASDIECEPPFPPDASVLVAHLRNLCGEEGAARAAQIKALAHDRLSAGGLGSDKKGRSALMEKIRQYDELRLELAALTSERDSLQSERDGLTAHLDALAASRDEIFKSLSWRLTAPLRYLGKFLMRRKV